MLHYLSDIAFVKYIVSICTLKAAYLIIKDKGYLEPELGRFLLDLGL